MCRIRIYSTQTRRKFKTAKTVMHQLSVCDPEVFRIVLIVNSWGALLEGGGGGGGGHVMGNIRTAIVVGVQTFYHKRTAKDRTRICRRT